LRDSVRFRLSFSVSVAILLIALVAGVIAFASSLDEAHELQDDLLREVAAVVASHPNPAGQARNDETQGDSDGEVRVIVQSLSDSGKQPRDSGFAIPLQAAVPDGLHTLLVDGVPFRVLIKTDRTGERFAVAQETRVRDETAREGAFRVLVPFLVLLPILLLLVARLVRVMFQPIDTLSAEIDQRAGDVLDPIDGAGLPKEIRPFAVAINRLLGRVSQSVANHQRFLADAAHELRSPLTALSLQAERLAEAEMAPSARERLATLRLGIERGRRLLEQLLTLARVQATNVRPESPVSVREIYGRVLEDIFPLAERKAIDVGVEGEEDARVWVNEADLTTIVRNLLDNAIRYTPSSGRIDLSVQAEGDRVVLEVKDTGAGIPPDERGRVFEPFYRARTDEPGSGLGLAIVKAIADRTGGRVELGYSDESARTGLRVSVSLPMGRLHR
jgi:two-component system OmpR family sensor kinase